MLCCQNLLVMKPTLLDLYCCGGGAGRGYELAGFDVTGVDIVPQPKHRGKFIADILTFQCKKND